MNPVESFLAELLKLLTPPGGVEMTEEVKKAYKLHGFDPEKPPTDSELAKWATELIYNWHSDPTQVIKWATELIYNWHSDPTQVMNLPIVGLCIGYNMTTWGKLSQLDQMNLKTLLCSVYNMGYAMGAYKLRSPFDKKPQPQELN